MDIILSPQRRDDELVLVKEGDSLIFNGQSVDFSGVGDEDPYNDPSNPWLVQAIRKPDGQLAVTVLMPHGRNPSKPVAFPEPLINVQDGEVIYPKDDPVETEPEIPTVPGSDVPLAVSDRQFVQQLAVMGLITKVEALAYVRTGTLPQAFTDLVAQLPEDLQFDALMKLTGANSFERYNPLTEIFASMYQISSAEVDDLWRAASLL